MLINVLLSFSDFRYQRIYAIVKGFFTKRFNLVEYLYLIRRANDNSITPKDLNPLTPKIWLLILLSRCYTFPFNELFNQLIYAYGISFSSNAQTLIHMIKFLSNKEHKSRRKQLYMEHELDRLEKCKMLKICKILKICKK